MPIAGITASQLLTVINGGGGGGGLNALASIDFVNGVYTIDGASVAVGDIIDNPGAIDPSGLLVPEFGTPIEMLGDLLALMLTANWTIVFEFEIFSLTGQIWMLSLCEFPVDGTRDMIQFWKMGPGNILQVFDDTGPGATREVNLAAATIGIHKVAIAREDNRLSASLDGGAVVTDTNNEPITSLTNATFGGFTGIGNDRDFYVRSMAVYDLQDDSVLPDLST